MIYLKTTVSMLPIILYNASFGTFDLEYIRKNYERAVIDKTLCATLIDSLSKNTQSNVHSAYLGAFLTIWANHTVNPTSKLNTFNRGRAKIDAAVVAEPNNVEIRMIRLSIQKKSPSILGYKSEIENDQLFIKNNLHLIQSPSLRSMCDKIIN